MRRSFSVMLLVAALFTGVAPAVAQADPLPGYDFDPVKLRDRMDRCLRYAQSEQEVLMGWVNMRDGVRRQWRCSSLRHMYFDNDAREGGNRHDPYVDIPSFMRCVDEVVSYGFSRPGDTGKTRLIKNFNGTRSQAYVIVNDATGDIATIYTAPQDNDWAGCAKPLYL